MDACDEPDCEATLRELNLFLDNELSAEERQSITGHLEACPDCFSAFDFQAELQQVIRAKCRNEEMPSDLIARIERCFDTDLDGDGQIG